MLADTLTTLSVIIPAYNEEASICDVAGRVLSSRPALLQAGVQELDVIVVDDCSQDRTAELAGALAGVRLIRHETNRGYGAALKTGFQAARGELLGFLDADGTYPPEYLPEMCRAALDGADLVIGSRMLGSKSEMPPLRRLGNRLFAGLVSMLGSHRISDSASGMRVFRRSVWPRLCPLPDGLNLTPVMSTRAVHEGLRMTEVPIPYGERTGRSKLSVVRDGLRFGNSIVWTALGYNPARILGGLGLALLAVAMLIAGVLTAQRLSGLTVLDAWGVFGVFSGAVLAVAGVSLFTLGATFNYLVSLLHQRPVRQGLLGRPLFDQPLERHFGWAGLLLLVAGVAVGLASLIAGLSGWPVSRLWLYQLASALAVILGLQLMVSWLIMRVLEELRNAR